MTAIEKPGGAQAMYRRHGDLGTNPAGDGEHGEIWRLNGYGGMRGGRRRSRRGEDQICWTILTLAG